MIIKCSFISFSPQLSGIPADKAPKKFTRGFVQRLKGTLPKSELRDELNIFYRDIRKNATT